MHGAPCNLPSLSFVLVCCLDSVKSKACMQSELQLYDEEQQCSHASFSDSHAVLLRYETHGTVATLGLDFRASLQQGPSRLFRGQFPLVFRQIPQVFTLIQKDSSFTSAG